MLLQCLTIPQPEPEPDGDGGDAHGHGGAADVPPVWSVCIVDSVAQTIMHQRRCEQKYGRFELGQGLSTITIAADVPSDSEAEEAVAAAAVPAPMPLTLSEQRAAAAKAATNKLLRRLWVVSGNRDGVVTVWDVATRAVIRSIEVGETQILSREQAATHSCAACHFLLMTMSVCIAVHVDAVSGLLIAAGFDGVVRVFSVHSGGVIQQLHHAEAALCSDVDWDSGLLAVYAILSHVSDAWRGITARVVVCAVAVAMARSTCGISWRTAC